MIFIQVLKPCSEIIKLVADALQDELLKKLHSLTTRHLIPKVENNKPNMIV